MAQNAPGKSSRNAEANRSDRRTGSAVTSADLPPMVPCDLSGEGSLVQHGIARLCGFGGGMLPTTCSSRQRVWRFAYSIVANATISKDRQGSHA